MSEMGGATVKLPRLQKLKASELTSIQEHFKWNKDILTENGFFDFNAATIKGALLQSIEDCEKAYKVGLDLAAEDWSVIEGELVSNYADGGVVREQIENAIMDLSFDDNMMEFVSSCRSLHRRFMNHSGTNARFYELVLPKLDASLLELLTRLMLDGAKHGTHIEDFPVSDVLDKLKELIRARRESLRYKQPAPVADTYALHETPKSKQLGRNRTKSEEERDERDMFASKFGHTMYILLEGIKGQPPALSGTPPSIKLRNKNNQEYMLAGYADANAFYDDLKRLDAAGIHARKFTLSKNSRSGRRGAPHQ